MAGLDTDEVGHCVECIARQRLAAPNNDKGNIRAQALRVLRGRRCTALTKGIEFSITIDDVGLPPSHCPVLGTPMKWLKCGQGKGHSSPSLDRIDPKRGYVPGNVIWISSRANRIKYDATPDELRRVATFYS